jgi:hypothetical protein
VEAVDTVAAGDAFNSALAVALAEGLAFPDALRWGLAAGALAVTGHGAQPSLPRRAEVMALLNRNAPAYGGPIQGAGEARLFRCRHDLYVGKSFAQTI